MASRSLDDTVARLAAAQCGLVGLTQAQRLGLNRSMIRHRLDTGRWVPVHRGVVRLAGVPESWEAEVLAGWLVLGRRAVVARHAAAQLLGLDGLRSDPTVEFVAERGSGNSAAGLTVHHSRSLKAIDQHTHRRYVAPAARRDRRLRHARLVTSYRVTSASRTIIDLAPLVTEPELAALVDSACRMGLSSPTFLAQRLEALRVRGRSGVGLVDRALFDAGGHSVLERALLRALRSAGLPRPTCQVIHSADGRRIGRVDFDFSPIPVIVEVNGARGHASDPDRAKDARRRNELQQLGFVVLEFTYSQVMADPAGTATTIATVLNTRT